MVLEVGQGNYKDQLKVLVMVIIKKLIRSLKIKKRKFLSFRTLQLPGPMPRTIRAKNQNL